METRKKELNLERNHNYPMQSVSYLLLDNMGLVKTVNPHMSIQPCRTAAYPKLKLSLTLY